MEVVSFCGKVSFPKATNPFSKQKWNHRKNSASPLGKISTENTLPGCPLPTKTLALPVEILESHGLAQQQYTRPFKYMCYIQLGGAGPPRTLLPLVYFQ